MSTVGLAKSRLHPVCTRLWMKTGCEEKGFVERSQQIVRYLRHAQGRGVQGHGVTSTNECYENTDSTEGEHRQQRDLLMGGGVQEVEEVMVGNQEVEENEDDGGKKSRSMMNKSSRRMMRVRRKDDLPKTERGEGLTLGPLSHGAALQLSASSLQRDKRT